MTLQDDTGSIDAKLWNASEEQVQTLVKGSVVQIKGDVIKYNEDRQMKIVKIHLASQDDKERIKFLKQAPLKVAESFCTLYPTLNKDLLYSGITLHDLGKTIELSGPVVPEYTLEGKLLGHISISNAMIKETANKLHIEGEEVTLLQHMILAHHGKNEYGSPVLPQIKEAEILYLIDNIDARMAMMDKALETVEYGKFTKRVFSLENRALYKPKMYEK